MIEAVEYLKLKLKELTPSFTDNNIHFRYRDEFLITNIEEIPSAFISLITPINYIKNTNPYYDNNVGNNTIIRKLHTASLTLYVAMYLHRDDIFKKTQELIELFSYEELNGNKIIIKNDEGQPITEKYFTNITVGETDFTSLEKDISHNVVASATSFIFDYAINYKETYEYATLNEVIIQHEDLENNIERDFIIN